MKNKILIYLLLIVSGVFFGFYGLITYQLYSGVKQAERSVDETSQNVEAMRQFLVKTFDLEKKANQ